jgi:two-component system response regulator LytT
MNCIMVDDEKMARAIVSTLCSSTSEISAVEEFDNAISAIKYLNQHPIDVVFLDIHMPGFSGVDFIQTLKDSPKIVLVTSDTDFAITAYEYEMIVDYLVKPITAERFHKSIQKIKSAVEKGSSEAPKDMKDNRDQADLYINIDSRLLSS